MFSNDGCWETAEIKALLVEAVHNGATLSSSTGLSRVHKITPRKRSGSRRRQKPLCGEGYVGATGLEPATPCSQNKRGNVDLHEAISTILQGISRARQRSLT
jgi:hypothetical protein